jgi:hypothetical protein
MINDTTPEDTEQTAEPQDVIIQGSYDFRITDGGEGRFCCNAGMLIPKVEGATGYMIEAHSFNDPLFFGTGTSDFIDPANPRLSDEGGARTPQEDEGDNWRIGLSGGCGALGGEDECEQNLAERFTGIVIDVIVSFD